MSQGPLLNKRISTTAVTSMAIINLNFLVVCTGMHIMVLMVLTWIIIDLIIMHQDFHCRRLLQWSSIQWLGYMVLTVTKLLKFQNQVILARLNLNQINLNSLIINQLRMVKLTQWLLIMTFKNVLINIRFPQSYLFASLNRIGITDCYLTQIDWSRLIGQSFQAAALKNRALNSAWKHSTFSRKETN